MKTILTTRQIREGKFLLRAPLIAVPLLTLVFWGLGGGKSRAENDKVVFHGFEMRLPAAHVASIVKRDKLEYYEAAKRDSAAAGQRERMEDSYAKGLGLDSSHGSALVHAVQEKLGAVKRVLARGAVSRDVVGPRGGLGSRSVVGVRRGVEGPNLEKLEQMMTVLQRDEGGNTEIAQLTAVLDRLAVLQGVREDTVRRKAASAVAAKRAVAVIKALPDDDDTARGFDSAAIEAIVPEEQVLVSGGELRLELVRDVLVDGRRIPAGTPVFGTVSLSGERLRVSINSIVWQERVLPVALQVDDEDGLTGIYIPGAPVTDAARESLGSEVGAIGPTVVNTGVAGQAVDAGVSLGRQLIGKKIRPVRVTVPAGYRVLLHPKNDGL
jgi:hypothetical protein